jgi:hypothetical protein
MIPSILISSEHSQNPSHVSRLSLSIPAIRFTIIFPSDLPLDALITFLVGLDASLLLPLPSSAFLYH